MNVFDVRHLSLMLKIIAKFEMGQSCLSDLICDLEAILDVFEDMDELWKNKVRSYWWNLEQVYAVGLECSEKILGDEDVLLIHESLEKIKNLACEALMVYLREYNYLIKEFAEVLDDEWLMCKICNDAWMTNSLDAMVICPECDNVLHNPRYVLMPPPP